MKSLLSALLVLGSLSASAEMKPYGTVVAEQCGGPSKTLTVCTAHAVGSKQAYLTLSTVKSHQELPAKVRIIGPGLVLWKATKNGKSIELVVHVKSAPGGAVGTYKVDGQISGLAPFELQYVMHTM